MSDLLQLPSCGLYALTDAQLIPATTFIERVELALRGGVNVLQYRDKSADGQKRLQQARSLKVLCQTYAVPLIINDDVQLARQIHADGVHLGKDDGQLAEARAVLGKQAIIGVSCYNQLTRAQQAQAQGADYVAFGSFYRSSTKPQALAASMDLLVRAKDCIHVPIVAIGGIEVHNAPFLLDAGADFLAVVSGIFAQTNVQAAAASYQALFKRN